MDHSKSSRITTSIEKALHHKSNMVWICKLYGKKYMNENDVTYFDYTKEDVSRIIERIDLESHSEGSLADVPFITVKGDEEPFPLYCMYDSHGRLRTYYRRK